MEVHSHLERSNFLLSRWSALRRSDITWLGREKSLRQFHFHFHFWFCSSGSSWNCCWLFSWIFWVHFQEQVNWTGEHLFSRRWEIIVYTFYFVPELLTRRGPNFTLWTRFSEWSEVCELWGIFERNYVWKSVQDWRYFFFWFRDPRRPLGWGSYAPEVLQIFQRGQVFYF